MVSFQIPSTCTPVVQTSGTVNLLKIRNSKFSQTFRDLALKRSKIRTLRELYSSETPSNFGKARVKWAFLS